MTNSQPLLWRVLLAVTAGTAAVAVHASGEVLYAGGTWAAIDRGLVCEALSRSQRAAPKGQPQAEVGVAFASDRTRWGQFHVRLSRMPRGDAGVMLRIGDQSFLLAARGGWAWSRGGMQAEAIVAALRDGTTMGVESRDQRGVKFRDPYLLDGAPTAIDAAAARCALRGAGKIR